MVSRRGAGIAGKVRGVSRNDHRGWSQSKVSGHGKRQLESPSGLGEAIHFAFPAFFAPLRETSSSLRETRTSEAQRELGFLRK